MKPILVLCLGNEVLCDDALGPNVAQGLNQFMPSDADVEVVFSPRAGFSLLDLLNNRRNVLIVDSIRTGQAPVGKVHFFPEDHLIPSNGLVNSHQISLPTALELGGQLGYKMPDKIDILAVEVSDIETLTEKMTAEVEASVYIVIEQVKDWINRKKSEIDDARSGEQRLPAAGGPPEDLP